MSKRATIVAFAGSNRADSCNRKALAVAVSGAREAGAEVVEVDLKEYEMPLYDQDLEEANGIPDSVKALRDVCSKADGLLIACPEYNSSITPLLKNTIDWLSRPDGDTPALTAFSGKAVALLSASPGQLGGLRGLVHVRDILGNINMHVIPQQVAVGGAYGAFNEDGSLKDEKRQQSLHDLGKALTDVSAKLRAS